MIDKVKNFFKKGVNGINSTKTLSSITDHPNINIDAEELARIQSSLDMYKGNYPKISYLNSNKSIKQRDYMFINMMEQTAKTMANIVFNEQCEITVSTSKKKEDINKLEDANEFIQHVFEHNDFKKNFAKYLEPMFALGGLAVRPYYDAISNEIEFSWALADAFFPIRSNTNSISEGVIISKTQQSDGNKTIYYTLMEFHEWQNSKYMITNELYKSEAPGEVGNKVALSELYDDLPPVVFMDLTRPNFSYLKPNGFNNLNPYSPLGLGICDNCKTTLKQINDAYDQFHWEIKMSQKRVIMSDHFLQTTFDEKGQRPVQQFDEDTNIFVGVNGDIDNMQYKDITTDIRSSQYSEAINQFFKALEMQVGFSSGTFSFDGQSVKTATEIVSENSTTYRTRNSQIVEVEKFIKELVISVLELAKLTKKDDGSYMYSGDLPTMNDIQVDFDDGVFTDKDTQLHYNIELLNAGLLSRASVMERQLNMSEADAQEELAKINQETLSNVFKNDPEINRILSDRMLFGEVE